MALRPMEAGPVGRRLTENLVRLRKQEGLKQQDLSKLLDATGRPITSSALSRVEQGDRRVDVDDLVALAVVLDVTPNHLLLTEDATDAPVEITPMVTVTRQRAWQWACGDLPLRDDDRFARKDEASGRLVLGGLTKIEARRPHEPINPMTFEQVFANLQAMTKVRQAVRVLEDQGLTRRQVLSGLSLLDVLVEASGQLDSSDDGQTDAG